MRAKDRSHRRGKAATGDIVGKPRSQRRVPAKWAEANRHLLELLDTLGRRRSELAQDALEEKPTFSTHMADAGTDTYDRDVALGLLSAEQDALYEIEEALERIRNGTYGICELTGRPIEPARLAAIPWTRFTAEAEQRLEREGVIKRGRRLGPRESLVRERPDAAEEQEP